MTKMKDDKNQKQGKNEQYTIGWNFIFVYMLKSGDRLINFSL